MNNSNNIESKRELDFNEFISLERKQKSSGIKRQVTISKYATVLNFNFEKIIEAIRHCKIRKNDDFGVIDIRDSKEHELVAKESDITELNVGTEWIRALFGVIGENSFRRLNHENLHIEQYIMKEVLKETFLVEYFQQGGNLCFLTYGGSENYKKIEQKHKIGFGKDLNAEPIEFEYDKVRQICLSFKEELSSIDYIPKGQPDYGDADLASLKTKQKKFLKSDAKLIKETLEKPEILIQNFEAWHSIENHFFGKEIRLKFKFSKNGHVTIYIPEMLFKKHLPEIDFENTFYDIIRGAYAEITDWEYLPTNSHPFQKNTGDQLLIDFIENIG